MTEDTIFALASAPGKSGVAVIRISGPNAFDGSSKLCKLPKAGQHRLRNIFALDGILLDQALVLAFPEGSSFTGEEVVELQTHGSPAVVSAVLSSLDQIDGFRPAEAGEFTRRALSNGRLNLSQVEGLADLLEAETEHQRKIALRVFSGEFSELADTWRIKLIRSRALIEATLDFSDEEVPVDVMPEVRELVGSVRGQIEEVLSFSGMSEQVKNGFEVAIVGPPNAGKSSLINAITGRMVAIVSDQAGTTRDILEVKYDLEGIPITLFDTAGIRESVDTVEKLGVELAISRAENADLRIFLRSDPADEINIQNQDGDLEYLSKGDLFPDKARISAKTGKGLDLLLTDLRSALASRIPPSVTTIRSRQQGALRKALGSLDLIEGIQDPEIIAIEIQNAVNELSFAIGVHGIESVLDDVFSSFCIGK